jgi:hypothetical protein
VHPPPQIAGGSLADPAPVDVEHELGTALHEHGAGIDRGKRDDRPILAMLDQVVDDPALQFQRHDFEQKHRDGQQHEE